MANIKSYNEILDRLTKRLKSGREHEIVYQVPPYYVGDTSYSSKQCKVFLIAKLRGLKYEVTYKAPNYLYIKSKQSKGHPLAKLESASPATQWANRAQQRRNVMQRNKILKKPTRDNKQINVNRSTMRRKPPPQRMRVSPQIDQRHNDSPPNSIIGLKNTKKRRRRSSKAPIPIIDEDIIDIINNVI